VLDEAQEQQFRELFGTARRSAVALTTRVQTIDGEAAHRPESKPQQHAAEHMESVWKFKIVAEVTQFIIMNQTHNPLRRALHSPDPAPDTQEGLVKLANGTLHHEIRAVYMNIASPGSCS